MRIPLLPLFPRLLLIALCVAPSIKAHSDAASVWRQRSPLPPGNLFSCTDNLYGVAYGLNLFVAVGEHARLITSSDGVNWVNNYLGTTAPTINAVTFANGTFVAVGSEYTLILTSTNGSTWVNRRSTIGTERLYGIAYGNGVYVAVGENHSSDNTLRAWVESSSDSANWNGTLLALPVSLKSIAFGHGLFVVVGDNGTILSSADGLVWTSRVSNTANGLRTVVYADRQFTSAGDLGVVLNSTDGLIWGAGAPTSFTNRGLAYGDGSFLAVGAYQASGRVQVSHDAKSWPGTSLDFSNALNAVAYGNASFVAVGQGGMILQSELPARLSDPRFSPSGFEATIDWKMGESYKVQTSTDAVHWNDILSRTAAESSYRFRDATATGSMKRLYRVISP